MSNLVELYLADINNTPTSKIDLLGNRIRELANSGTFWNPITPKPDNTNSIFEIIPNAILGSSQEIAELKAKLDIRAVDIYRWTNNRLRKNSTWLYFRFKSSPVLLRDIVYSIQWAGSGTNDAYLIDEYLQGTLTIERRGRWENLNILDYSVENMPTCGSFFNSRNHGTDDSRIALLEIDTPPNEGREYAVDEVWVGIREVLDGTEDFNPLLPFSAGRRENNLQPDGTLTLPDTSLLRRFRISIGEVIGIGNPTHYIGRYTVLLKQQSSDSNTVYLMKYGNRANDTLKTEYRRVYINNSDVSWVNLGEIEIPAGNNRLTAVSDIRNSEIELWIGRTSGAGTVQLFENPLLLVPSRRYLYIKSEPVQSNGSTLLQFRVHEDNSKSYELRLSTGEVLTGVPHPRNFSLPYEGYVVVYASQRNGIADNTNNDISVINVNYYHRFYSYANRQYTPTKSGC